MPPPADKHVARVVEALQALKDPGGSGRAKIAKVIGADLNAVQLKKALEAGVASGVLVQTKQSFSIAGVTFEVPADMRIETEVLREPTDATSAPAAAGDTVAVRYEGRLLDGTVFDGAPSFTFLLGGGEVIKGWDQGVQGMRKGEQRRLTIPPKLGYGKRGSPPEIPPDATLVFDVTLL